jgi:hypothetical protein
MNNDRWQQVERLLSGALLHPPDVHSRFRDEVYGAHPVQFADGPTPVGGSRDQPGQSC